MTVTLTLAKPGDLDRVERFVAAFHDHEGIDTAEDERRAALAPILEGSPHGVIYLIGPPKSPVGYAMVSFGWSLAVGGLDGFLDEIFIRHGVRGRGMGSDALGQLATALARHGVRALHLEVAADNDEALAFYGRLGFRLHDDHHLMSKRL